MVEMDGDMECEREIERERRRCETIKDRLMSST
jgi:hypothetical protein